MEIPEKNIFEYWNGERAVYGDPLAILRTFTRGCDGDVDGVFELSQSENPDQSIPASEKILAAARVAMRMTPFDPATGLGATDEVVFAELDRFFDWWAKKKPITASSPTLPPAMA